MIEKIKNKVYVIAFPTLIVAFMLVLTQCKREKKPYQFYKSDFKSHKNIGGTALSLSQLVKPADICVIPEKNLLLVTDLNSPDFIKVYELGSLKFLKSFARKGSGPTDQLDCHKLQYNLKQNVIYASDMYKRKIFVYAIDDILSAKTVPLPISDISLQDKYFYRPLILSNGTIVDFRLNTPDKPLSLLNFYDTSGQYLFSKGSYPAAEKHYDLTALSFAFAAGFTMSKDGKAIVVSYLNTDYIDIYDLAGNLKKRVQGPDIFDAYIKNDPYLGGMMIHLSKKGHRAYSVPRMKDDEIYVLYDGGSGNANNYHHNTLFYFNDNLTPAIMYTLNEPVFAFDIDWKSKTIYGLTHQIKGKSIIKYQLK